MNRRLPGRWEDGGIGLRKDHFVFSCDVIFAKLLVFFFECYDGFKDALKWSLHF